VGEEDAQAVAGQHPRDLDGVAVGQEARIEADDDTLSAVGGL